MKGLNVPLVGEDFSADPSELFFDLAYVLAFSQLVGLLVHHPDWKGVGQAALLFLLMWLPWSQFTWSANAVSGNGRVVRLIFLIGTAIAIPMAASVSTAFESSGATFATSLALIYALALGTMGLSLSTIPTLRHSLAVLAPLSLLGVGIIVVGGFLDGSARVWMWLATIVVIVLTMAAAGRVEWVVRPAHFAERHGLIFIIALGEVIVAIGIAVIDGLEGGEVSGSARLALLFAGIFVGALWWSYFDRPLPALEHGASEIEDLVEAGSYGRDVYTLSHAPIIGGVILAAAGLEELMLHPDEALHAEFRAMLIGGVAMIFVGIVGAVYRAFRVLAVERLAAIAVLVLAAVLGGSMRGVVFLIVVDLILILVLILEHIRIENVGRAVRVGSRTESKT